MPRAPANKDSRYFADQIPDFGRTSKLGGGPNPARVLIICQDQRSYGLRRELEALDANVRIVAPVPEALAIAQELVPDLILLERVSRDVVELDILGALKKDPRTHVIPVIVLSAADDTEIRVRSLDEGASDCLTRPSSLAESMARIRAVLRTKIREDLLRRRVGFLEELAASDPLTSLLNYRAFIDRFHLEMERAARNEQPLSCLILDIDWFKNVNDRYGHQVGDDVLRQIAKVMVEGRRAGDPVSRLGGEEFVWLLPGVDREALLERAEWLRRAIEGAEIPTTEGTFRVSVSIGVSCYQFNEHGRISAHELLARADAALLQAKRQGKNRIVFRELIAPERNEDEAPVSETTRDAQIVPMPGTPRRIPGAGATSLAPDFTLHATGADATVQGELRKILHSSVKVLTAALEARDSETMTHCRRVASMATAIAMEMGLPAHEIERIELASLLHDLGKLAVPDTVLQKPAALTAEEWLMIKKHPERGAAILQDAKSFSHLVDLVLYHQESFDGTGYPDGIAGDSIPLGARIIRVADTFDALTSDRAYRPRKTLEEAKVELRRMAGTTLDPTIVEALLRLLGTMSPLEIQLTLRQGCHIANLIPSEDEDNEADPGEVAF